MNCDYYENELFEQTLEIGETELKLDAITPKVPNEKIHACTFEGCNAKFNRPYRLKQHLLTHAGKKAFQCSYENCNKSYTSKTHLQRHISTSHDTEALEYKRSFKCPYPGCGVSIRHESNLRRHYMRAHEPRQFKHQCKHCPQSFCKEQQLLTHELQHTTEAALRCELCGLGFARKRLLVQHTLRHRIYQCDVPDCPHGPFKFTKWFDLVKHRRTYHPEIFSCDFCGHQFAMKARLQEHMTSHLDKSAKEVFVCPYDDCSRYYYHKKNLQNHIRRVHIGNRCECPHEDCVKTFSCRARLKQHMKQHEPGYNSGRTYVRGPDRKQRKDAGTHKRSLAVKLAGVIVPFEYEKSILEEQGENVRSPSPYNSLTFTDNFIVDQNTHTYVKEESSSD